MNLPSFLPLIPGGWYSQIEDADAVERKWACVAVSNLIHNDPSTRRLLQGKNVVGTLIGRLTDSEEEVIVEAAGALRCVLFGVSFEVPFSRFFFMSASDNNEFPIAGSQKSMHRWRI